jgi:hypothetical protein
MMSGAGEKISSILNKNTSSFSIDINIEFIYFFGSYTVLLHFQRPQKFKINPVYRLNRWWMT